MHRALAGGQGRRAQTRSLPILVSRFTAHRRARFQNFAWTPAIFCSISAELAAISGDRSSFKSEAEFCSEIPRPRFRFCRADFKTSRAEFSRTADFRVLVSKSWNPEARILSLVSQFSILVSISGPRLEFGRPQISQFSILDSNPRSCRAKTGVALSSCSACANAERLYSAVVRWCV